MPTPADATIEILKPGERRDDYKRLRLTFTVAAGLLAMGALFGGVASSLGFKKYGPPEQIEAVRRDLLQRDSMVTARVFLLEAGQTDLALKLEGVRTDQEFHSYLLCVILRRTDGAAVPSRCAGNNR